MYQDLYPFNLMRKIIPPHHTDDQLDNIYIKGFHEEVAKLPQSFQGYIQRRYVNHMSQSKCAKELGINVEQAKRMETDICRQLRRQKRDRRYTAVSRDSFEKLERKYNAMKTENETLRALLQHVIGRKIDPSDITFTDGQISAPDVVIENAETITIPIQDLNFSTRVYNVLGRAGIETLGEIAKHTRHEIKDLRGMGVSGVDEIYQALITHGLSFSATPYDQASTETPEPLTALDVDLVNKGFFGKDKLNVISHVERRTDT